MRGAGVFGKSPAGVWVCREGVALPLRYESPCPPRFLVLSLDGETEATGPGWEAPGEGLPLAGCGRSYFLGHPAVGSAHHCPGCAGLGAPGSGTTGEWLQQAPEGCILWTFIDLCALASLAQLVALARGHVWSVSACSPRGPTLMLQVSS